MPAFRVIPFLFSRIRIHLFSPQPSMHPPGTITNHSQSPTHHYQLGSGTVSPTDTNPRRAWTNPSLPFAFHTTISSTKRVHTLPPLLYLYLSFLRQLIPFHTDKLTQDVVFSLLLFWLHDCHAILKQSSKTNPPPTIASAISSSSTPAYKSDRIPPYPLTPIHPSDTYLPHWQRQ